MTIFELLYKNDRIIVWSSEEDQVIYTWNQSLTLQRWRIEDFSVYQEVDIRTLEQIPSSFEEARKKAQDWDNAI